MIEVSYIYVYTNLGPISSRRQPVLFSPLSHYSPQLKIVDLNRNRINMWISPSYDLPIYEPGFVDVVKEARDHNLFFSTSMDKAIQEADLIFVSVSIPTKNYRCWLCSRSQVRCFSFLSPPRLWYLENNARG